MFYVGQSSNRIPQVDCAAIINSENKFVHLQWWFLGCLN